MILPRKAIAIAAAVLALGGVGAGTASAATLLPAATVSHSTVDTPEPGDVPDVEVHNPHNHRDRLEDRRNHENTGNENAAHRGMGDRSGNTVTSPEHSVRNGR